MPRLGASLADISMKVVPITDGAHRASIVEAKMGKSKNNIPMVTLSYEISEGDFKGRKLSDYFTLQTNNGDANEAGLRGLKRIIAATLGEDRANADDFDTDELVGQDVEIVVKQESYTDPDTDETSIQNKVKKVIAPR